jgi:hypothetical protein
MVPESRDAVAKARWRVETHRWMAAARDRDQFGEAGPDGNVTLNYAQLHLDALLASCRAEPVFQRGELDRR